MAKLEIEKHSGRSIGTASASETPDPSRVFGNTINRGLTEIPNAPAGKFNVPAPEFDFKGNIEVARSQAAFGQALTDVGQALNSIAERQRSLQVAQDQVTWHNMEQEARLRSKQIELDLNRRWREEGLSPEQLEGLYNEELETTFEELREKHQFNYVPPERLDAFFKIRSQEGQLDFSGRTLEKIRVQKMQRDFDEAHVNRVTEAAIAGTKFDAGTLIELVETTENLVTNPAFATLNGPGATQQLMKDIVMEFLRNARAANPNLLHNLLNDPDSPIGKFFNSLMDKDSLAVLNDDVAGFRAENAAALETANKKRQALIEGRAELDIAMGRMRIGDVQALPIDDSRKATLINKIKTRDKALQTRNEDYRTVLQDTAAGITYVDDKRTEKLHNKVDNAYALFLEEYGDLPEEQRWDKIVEHVAATGVLPRPLRRSLTTQMQSDNEENVRTAVGRIQDLLKAQPGLEQDLTPDQKTFYELVSTGMTLANARDVMRRKSLLSKEGKESFKDAITAYKKDNEDYFVDFIKDSWGEKVVSPDAQAVYDRLLLHNLIDVDGNFEAAERLTQQQFKKKWAVSKVDGTPRLMEYAPEAGHHGDTSWMRRQLRYEMNKEHGLQEGQYMIGEVNRHSLRGHIEDRTFTIWKTTEYGALVPLETDWRPDYSLWLEQEKEIEHQYAISVGGHKKRQHLVDLEREKNKKQEKESTQGSSHILDRRGRSKESIQDLIERKEEERDETIQRKRSGSRSHILNRRGRSK